MRWSTRLFGVSALLRSDRNVSASKKGSLARLSDLEFSLLLGRQELAFFTQLLTLRFLFLLAPNTLGFFPFFLLALLAFFFFYKTKSLFLSGALFFFRLFLCSKTSL